MTLLLKQSHGRMYRTGRLISLLAGLTLCSGCTTHVPPSSPVSWHFEARPENGQIEVMPVLSVMDLGEVNQQDFIGPIPPWRLQLRQQRMASIKHVPEAVGMALPGALASNLPANWPGQFHVGHFPGSSKSKLTDLISQGDSLDQVLYDIGSRKKDVSTLISWVEDIHATPITQEAAAGDFVASEVGPIVVNLFEESYRIRATIGMALIASDGEVILRYQDVFESVLGDQRNTHRVGRDLAIRLAEEITKMWPIDPRLKEDAI